MFDDKFIEIVHSTAKYYLNYWIFLLFDDLHKRLEFFFFFFRKSDNRWSSLRGFSERRWQARHHTSTLSNGFYWQAHNKISRLCHCKIEYFSLFEVEGEIGHESQSFITMNPFQMDWEKKRNWKKERDSWFVEGCHYFRFWSWRHTHTHQICMHLCIYKIHPNNNKRAPNSTIVQVSASRCPSICERIIVSLLLTQSICTRSSIFYRNQTKWLETWVKATCVFFFHLNYVHK